MPMKGCMSKKVIASIRQKLLPEGNSSGVVSDGLGLGSNDTATTAGTPGGAVVVLAKVYVNAKVVRLSPQGDQQGEGGGNYLERDQVVRVHVSAAGKGPKATVAQSMQDESRETK